MVNVADLMITSLDTITAYALDGVPKFILDELQDVTIANTQEKADITGKQGRKIGSLKRNKAVTISGNNGLLSAGMLESQVGTAFEANETAPVKCTDYLTITSNKATTEAKAVGTAGAEIDALYIIGENGVASEKLEQASAAGDKKFAYDPETKALSFNSGAYPDGTQIVVFYTRNVSAEVLSNLSDTYSEKLRVTVDGTAEDKCGNIYHIQYNIPLGDFNGNFDIQMGGDQTVHAFEIESMSGSCGGAGTLWTCTVFGVNA